MGRIGVSALADKYGDFLYPKAAVIAAGVEIPESESWRLENVEVNASVGRDPDMAVLVYRVDKLPPNRQADLEGYLEVGQKMEVRAGYAGQTSRIFLGYLHQVEVNDLMQGFLEYTLICLDVKGLMKKNSVFQVSGARKLQQIRDDILEESGYQFLVEKKSVSTLPENLNLDCVVRGDTHYDWLCNLAEYLDYEFFAAQGSWYSERQGKVRENWWN